MTRMQSKIAQGRKHHKQAPSERADYRNTPTKTSDTGIIRNYNTIYKKRQAYIFKLNFF